MMVIDADFILFLLFLILMMMLLLLFILLLLLLTDFVDAIAVAVDAILSMC